MKILYHYLKMLMTKICSSLKQTLMNVYNLLTTATQNLLAPTLMDPFYVFVRMMILEIRSFAKVIKNLAMERKHSNL